MILPVAVLKGIMIKYEKDEEKEVKLLKAKYVQCACFPCFSIGGGVGDDGVQCKDPCLQLTWSRDVESSHCIVSPYSVSR